MWDKPKKVMSTEQWASNSADGAPPGVYEPNMSQEDKERWKAKAVTKKSGHKVVEIRKSFGGTQCLIIVSANHDGVPDSKQYEGSNYINWLIYPDCSVKISMNGNAQLTMTEVQQMPLAIQEAFDFLNS